VDGRDKPGHDEAGRRFRISSNLLESNAPWRVLVLPGYAGFLAGLTPSPIKPNQSSQTPRKIMIVTAAHITPLVAIIAGILILIIPRLLNYIVAIYLIFVGLVELNAIHHWFTWH
jgi:phosphatidylserine synthase